MALQLQMHRAGNQVDKMVESEAMGASPVRSVARVEREVKHCTDSLVAPDGWVWEAVFDALTLDVCKVADCNQKHAPIPLGLENHCRCVMIQSMRELTTPRRGPCRSS